MLPFWNHPFIMATLTIKNLPDSLYERLKLTAAKHRRSLNSEAIVQLEQSLNKHVIDVEETIERVRELRSKYPNVWLTDEDLELAKNEGRP